jgi:GNAT superfamily N-acetyltransferase
LKTETAFDVSLQAYSIHQLLLEDSGAIQTLYEKCLDFMLLVDGHPAGPNSGEEEFQDVPPGKSLDDKFVFGIVNRQNELVGILDVLRGYPDETTWWIGLFLLLPEVRLHGIGPKVFQAFAEYARGQGGSAIMLGVVEENTLAYQFWQKAGFEFISLTEPRQFGEKTQKVSVMRRSLLDAR